MAIIPSQKLFALQPHKQHHVYVNENGIENNKYIDYLDSFNIFKQLTMQPQFLIVTDVVNAISVSLLLLMLIGLLRVRSYNKYKEKYQNNLNLKQDDQSQFNSSNSSGSVGGINQYQTRIILNYLSKILILFGRFLQNIILGIQISAIKCYYKGEHSCNFQNDQIRLITNIIGIFVSLLIIVFENRFTQTIFPDIQMPWSKLSSRYEVINRLLIIYNVLALVLQSYTLHRFRYYIILIPVIILSLLMVWLSISTVKYFSAWVDTTHLIKDVALCNAYIYVASIDIINYKSTKITDTNTISDYEQLSLSEPSYIVLTFISIFSILALILLKKRNYIQEEFQIEELDLSHQKLYQNSQHLSAPKHHTEPPAPWKLYTLLNLIDKNSQSKVIDNQIDIELKLQQMFEQHINFCENHKCFCQSDKYSEYILNSQNLRFETINEKHDNPIRTEEITFSITNKKAFPSSSTTMLIIDDQEIRKQRNEVLVKLLIQKLKKSPSVKQVKFLEIYINHRYFNKLYSSYYKLQKFKLNTRSSNNSDKLNHFYLKTKIMESVKQYESKVKKDILNIDRLIQVEDNFIEYKRLIYETTILVERFWSTLQKIEFEIQEVIIIGQKIVDQYLLTKNLYDNMIEMDPQFKEIVQLQMNFNFNVMNFEMEGLNLQNLLKNIQQKISITRQSTYIKEKASQGIMLISANPDNKNKIILVSQLVCNMLQMSKSQLIGKSINSLMPKLIGQVHDVLVEKFLTYNHNRHLASALQRVWLKKQNQCLVPCKIDIQTQVSEMNGLVLSGLINFDQEVNIMNTTCKVKDAFIVITDDGGYIQNVSENFVERYMRTDQFAIDDSKINANDIFILPETTTEDDLKKGVTAHIIEKFTSIALLTKDNIETQSILLTMNKHDLPGQTQFREYIFVECDTSDNTEATMITSIHKYALNNNHQNNSFQMLHSLDNDMDQAYNGNGHLSSESGSSKSTELVNLKGAIDFKQTPRSLSNLKKAIVIFFCILIGTSFSVLGVTIVQNKQFLEDSEIVKASIKIGGILANLRLVFRMLVLFPRSNLVEEKFQFDYLQQQLELYYAQLQDNFYIALDESKYEDDNLFQFMTANNVQLSELQQDSSITYTKKKFTLALQQIMTKLQKFITIDKGQYIQEFKDFLVRAPPQNPTTNQRDAHFIIINGMYDIRSFSLQLYQLFVKQSQNKENEHEQTVLIITMSCIAITLLSCLFLIPVTFTLDTEQEGIVKQWLKVSNDAKQDILNRIDEFTQSLIEEKKKMQAQKSCKSLSTLNNNQNSQQLKDIKSQYGLDRIEFGSGNLSVLISNEKVNNDSRVLDFSSIGLITQNHGDRPYQSFENTNNYNSSGIFLNRQYNVPDHQAIKEEYFESRQSKLTNSQKQQPIITTNAATQQKTDEEQMQKITQSKLQKQQLKKIYRNHKIKKILFILSFATVIFGFYIGFYFISAQVFKSAKESFVFLTNINRRTPCLSNVQQLLMETYIQNKTLAVGYINETVMNHAQETCMVYEKRIQEYQSNSPPQFELIDQFIKDLNTEKLCSLTFEGNIQKIQDCETFQNGIMKKGLSNTMNSMFYYIFTELIEFDQYSDKQWKRTDQFLNNHTYSSSMLNNIKMILMYILPAAEVLNQKVDYSLQKYMESQTGVFNIVFSLFLVFLVGSLYLSLGKLISYLKTDVFRSRVLVKIIPADELQEIYKKQRRKLNQKRQNR